MLSLRLLRRPLGRTASIHTVGVNATVRDVLVANPGVRTNRNSILLTSLPNTVTAAKLKESLKDIGKYNRLELQPGCSLHYVNYTDASIASRILMENAKLQVTQTDTFLPSITINALPVGLTVEDVTKAFAAFKPVVVDMEPYSSVKFTRSPEATADAHAFIRTKVPALFMHNVHNLPEETVEALVAAEPGFKRLAFVRDTQDGWVQRAVAYFESDAEALTALKKLRDLTVDGERVSVSFKQVHDPLVEVTNIPEEITAKKLAGYLKGLRPEISLEGGRALISLHDPKSAALAVSALHGIKLGENRISAREYFSTELTVFSADPAAITDASLPAVPACSHVIEQGQRAVVAFTSKQDVSKVLTAYHTGKVSLGAARVCAAMSTRAIPTLEAAGLSTDTSVSALLPLVSTPLKVDRVALLKCASHHQIVPTLKKLRTLEIDNQRVKAERFNPAVPVERGGEFDVQGEHERFTQYTSRLLNDDAMARDPAQRYQLIRNEFERALYDAQHDEDADLFDDYSLPPKVFEEGEALIKEANLQDPNCKATERLFEIYIQMQDNLKFSRDFAEMDILAGGESADRKHPFHWRNYAFDDGDHMNDTFKPMLKAEEEASRARSEAAMEAIALAKRKVKRLHVGPLDELDEEEDEYDEAADSELDSDSDSSEITDDSDEFSGNSDEGSDDSSEDSDDEDEEDDELAVDDEDSEISEDAEDGGEEGSEQIALGDGDEEDEDEDSDADDDSDDDSEGDEDDEEEGEDEEDEYDNLEIVDGKVKAKAPKFPSAKSLYEDGQIVLEGMDGEETVKVNLFDGEALQDAEGQTWSGIILNTDMTQKTMPGGRVLSHRVLVVIGNLRGAAGYGMGKGKDPKTAIEAAFRDGLRNLLHLDLYDNFGLAHDVYGKHNSCHAYIRATPRSRTLVASNLAEEILTRFGIGSASCRILGRRTPYAQVRAVFNALGKHGNLDEYARATGDRYLTLQWARSHGL